MPRDNDFLPPEVSPFPRALEGACAECGGPVHIYEADLSLAEDGSGRMVCGDCTRAIARRRGRDLRSIVRNFFWRHGHDPMDDDADKSSPYVYMKLEPDAAHPPEQRAELEGKGGPETPFFCQKCGTNLRAVADKSVQEVLRPLGYKPTPGTVAPRERVVVLMCPNDKPTARHPFMQIRESMLEVAMQNLRRKE